MNLYNSECDFHKIPPWSVSTDGSEAGGERGDGP